MNTDRIKFASLEAKSPRQRRHEAAAELAKSEGFNWNDLGMADQGVYLGMVTDQENQS